MSMSVVLLNRDVHVCDQSVALGVLVGAPTSAPDGKQRCWSKGFVNFEGGEMPSGGVSYPLYSSTVLLWEDFSFDFFFYKFFESSICQSTKQEGIFFLEQQDTRMHRRMITSLPSKLPPVLLLPVGGIALGAVALVGSHFASRGADELRKNTTIKSHPSTSLVCGNLVYNNCRRINNI